MKILGQQVSGYPELQMNTLRDAVVKQQLCQTRNKSNLMNSEGENLTMTADPSAFEDPIPLTQLKESLNPSSIGSAALKL